MSLDDLMETVLRHWSFDANSYPVMVGLSEKDSKVFALRHILMHQNKAVGRLAEVCEPADHGAPLDEEKLRTATRNFLINTLQLASVAGIRAGDLETAVQGWAAQKHAP